MADNRDFTQGFKNEGGAPVYCEDKKLSEISTKTTIASEGVMLKGTDGAYYEIDKASLSEVIRAELGAILADNSKNNGTSVAKVPTLNSSGNALGASSVADLASVLGAFNKDIETIGETGNLNNLGVGIFVVHPAAANVAPNRMGWHIVVSIVKDMVGVQFALDGNEEMTGYYRTFYNSSYIWPWKAL